MSSLLRATTGAPVLGALPAVLAALALALAGCSPGSEPMAGDHDHDDEAPAGPNGGRLLEQDGFSLEVVLAEADTGAEFRLYPSAKGAAVPLGDVQASLRVRRVTGLDGGRREDFAFSPRGDYLVGSPTAAEPHSFDIAVAARHAGRDYRWEYAAPEGLVTIAPEMAAAQGLTTAIAGPGTVRETITLYGSIEAVPARVRTVQARFPGIVRSVAVNLGDRVRSGQALATVESNDTLQVYTVAAPIAGTITARNANPGEATAGPLVTITDLTRVHADLTIFPRDRSRLRLGQPIEVRAADGDATGSGRLESLIPAAAMGTGLLAHVEIDNAQGQWTPGQFITAEVNVREGEVPLAVPVEAVQPWREWDAVFVVEGDRYQVVPVTLGRRDSRQVEVLGGLDPGARIVVGNSYLVKADIEKSGAAHDH